ncbi:MAG: hypothetical protein KJZ68_04140 [Phycisphaerales bacterium]|nr:hypothetical protein [Phycisphaerales bacterium]
MSRSTLWRCVLVGGMMAGGLPGGAAVAMAQDQENEVVRRVNQPILRMTEAAKSWKILFDAFLDLTKAPSASGRADVGFNLNTIHPRMSNWSQVSGWAETSPSLAQAILTVRDRVEIGLPYGDDIDQRYRSAGIYADLAVDGNLRDQDFAYLRVMDTIAAYVAAETYRLFEAQQTERALDLAIAHLYVVNQLLRREFLVEKMHAMRLMSDCLELLRDQMFTYFDQFTLQQFSSESYKSADGKERKGIAFELPFLRLDLLQMPEGDRVAASVLIDSVFDHNTQEAIPDRFADTFGKIQSADAPFTMFGSQKRWKLVSRFHASRLASQDQLTLVYDDWWRRWSIRAWHPLLELTPQYQRTTPVRFAGVTSSRRDLADIFVLRRQLTAAANATAVAAGICGYRKQFGNEPDDLEKVYTTYVRRRSDMDPFDKEGKGFGYRRVARLQVNAEALDDFVTVTGGLLWAKGNDLASQRGERHSRDGLTGDIVYWPPLRVLARQQGLMR